MWKETITISENEYVISYLWVVFKQLELPQDLYMVYNTKHRIQANSDLDFLLMKNWHYRGINKNGGYTYVY